MDDKKPYTAAFTQPIISPQGADMSQPMGSAQMAQPMQGQPMPGQGVPNVQQNPITGQPMISQSPVPEVPLIKRDTKSLIKTIAIIALSLLSLTFIGLFIWMFVEYENASTNVEGQVADAVVKAVDENTTKLEDEFTEREKYPFKTFAGPADYGELTFEYPKTWSVYVAKDARAGGDFEAYFNPVEVNEVSETTINALRLAIKDTAFDEVAAEYQDALENEENPLKLESVTIGKGMNITANRYTGNIPGTEFNGIIVIFKIRDKTAIMQTDSILFQADFDTLLSSVRFNA
ncbi:MAG: hypothetical protein Q4F58_01455 [Candidatus Saccharibacteria bacterium]|nr:hypothetical protein [Candidatus Saccharibacteria bacterium]